MTQTRIFQSLNVTGPVVPIGILLSNGDELNSVLPNFARPLFFSRQTFWHFHKYILVDETTESMIFHCKTLPV